MSRIDDLRARLTPGGIQPVDFHGRPFEPMFKASEVAPLLDVASAAEELVAATDRYADAFNRADHPIQLADAAVGQRDAHAALRAALDRLNAAGGAPATPPAGDPPQT